MRCGVWILSHLIGLSIGLVGAAQAQNTAPPLSQPASHSPAIQIADIPMRADTDHRFAEDVIQRVARTDPSDALEPRLEALAQSVDEKRYQFLPAQLRTLPIMRLESLERHWIFDAHRFERWQTDMQQATAAYTSDAAELVRRRANWQALKDSPEADSLPPALMARVDTVIAQLKQAEQALSAPLARQLALGQRANAVDERIRSGRQSVVDAIDYIDGRLMRLDSPPLWALGETPNAQGDAMALLRTGLGIEIRFAREYAAADSGNQRALHVLQVLLLPLLLWLAWQNRKVIHAGAMSQTAARVLSRPLSAWLLLAMMGVLVLEPDAPLIVQQVAMVLAAIPVLRLLPRINRRQLDLWPYAITALYLVERLGFLFLVSGILYRIYTVVLTVVALLTILWLLTRTRRLADTEPSTRIFRALRIVAWVAVSLLGISAISNVFGNVSLAEMLTSATLGSAYFGLMLYAGVTILITLLHLLLARSGLARLRLAREHAPPLVQLVIRLLTLSAIIGWAVYTMDRFRILRVTYSAVTQVLSYTVVLGEISISLGNILVFVISVLIAFWAARTIRVVLNDEVLTRMPLPRGVGNSIASLTYYSVLLFGLGVALSAAGFKTSQLAIVFGALGVGIGFGLQNVVNNFVSGLILMFERPIQPGDVVDIGDTSGSVREIGMRATRIKTFDGADVMVPNGALLSEKLTNWTLLDRNRRIEIKLGVAYGTDPKKVIEILEAVSRKTLGVAAEPKPVALFMAFGDSSLDFSLRAWTPDFDAWINIRSDMLIQINEAMAQAGIEIPFPQRDLNIRSVSDAVSAALTAGRQHTSDTPDIEREDDIKSTDIAPKP